MHGKHWINTLINDLNRYFGLILIGSITIMVFIVLYLKESTENDMLANEVLNERSYSDMYKRETEISNKAFCECYDILKDHSLRMSTMKRFMCPN